MQKFATLVAATGLAFGLTACGADNGPEEAVTTFGDAFADKDYETVCDTLDPEFVDQLEQLQEGKDCPTLLKENEDSFQEGIPDDAEMDIQDSEISDDEKTATVTVKNDDGKEEDLNLKKVEDEWKITFEQ